MSAALAPGGDGKRWTALAVLCTGFLMVILDQTIVTVALPSIQGGLRFSQPGLAWVVNAYLIAFGGLLLLAGRLGDLAGRRRVFLAGLAVFTAASLACGLARTQQVLIGARFVQGVGGAAMSAVILAMVMTMFPEPDLRARAVGVYSFVAAAGGTVGLLAGGILTQAVGWQWIFYVNVPIGAATAIAASRWVPADQGAGLRQGADAPGGVLLAAALMTLVYSIAGTGRYGWGSAHTLSSAAVAGLLAVMFIWQEARARRPLLPWRALRSRTAGTANLVQLLLFAGFIGTFFTGALYLQHVLRYDAIKTGLAFLPLGLSIGIASIGFAAPLTGRLGAKTVLMCGLALVTAGLVMFSRVPVSAGYALDLLPAMILTGVGAGIAFPTLMSLAMSAAVLEDSGLASGLLNTAQQAGGALGLAVLASAAAARTATRHAHGALAPAALADGYHLAYAIAAAAVILAAALAAVILPSPRSTTAPGQDTPATAQPKETTCTRRRPPH